MLLVVNSVKKSIAKTSIKKLLGGAILWVF